MKNDPSILGLCGETRIANKRTNWVTAIQVFEYYISHHLGKAFESVFGGVTCLPGCFCMYRVFAMKGPGDHWKIPLLASPDIVEGMLISFNCVKNTARMSWIPYTKRIYYCLAKIDSSLLLCFVTSLNEK
jgi:cellulose synthase/poly-beta-1,6-N-acetylglucosamine synthase-like glycosyltransferase